MAVKVCAEDSADNAWEMAQLPCGTNPEPWAKIGNLYLSFPQTGPGSWKQMLAAAYGKPCKRFLVLSGRHGQIMGGFGKDGRAPKSDIEHALYLQDVELAKTIREEHAADSEFSLTIADAGVGTAVGSSSVYAQKSRMLLRVRLELAGGMAVIFAWCHSFFSVYEFDDPLLGVQAAADSAKASAEATAKAQGKGAFAVGSAGRSAYTKAYSFAKAAAGVASTAVAMAVANRSVAAIVDESYKWVPRLI